MGGLVADGQREELLTATGEPGRAAALSSSGAYVSVACGVWDVLSERERAVAPDRARRARLSPMVCETAVPESDTSRADGPLQDTNLMAQD